MRQPLQSARAGGCTHGAASLLHMAFRLSVGSAIDRSLPGAFQVYLRASGDALMSSEDGIGLGCVPAIKQVSSGSRRCKDG
jgi:hypothetical protein